MGGNALKQFNTVRLPTSEVNDIATAIIERLSSDCRAAMIPSYRNKESHGDLDILIDFAMPTYVLQSIIFNLSPYPAQRIQTVENGPTRSLGIQLTKDSVFQVDFIYVHPKIYDFALSYFSYNDCGNFIGVIAHRTGLRFGHKGLEYAVRKDTHLIGTISLDYDFKSALELLGCDYNRWNHGFDDLVDIYQWIASSKFFNKEFYLLENRNHTARIRDKKRITYTGLLEWIRENNPPDGMPIDRKEWVDHLNSTIPSFNEQYQKIISNYEKNVLLKSKFNGIICSELTGLSGKELGQFMATVKPEISEEMDQSEINKKIGEYYEHHFKS